MERVLITGASTGIGLACVKKFLKNNKLIVAHYFESNDEFEQICSQNSENLMPIQADFSSENDLNAFLSKIVELKISSIVNVAGCFDFSKKAPNRTDAAKKIFCVNTIAPYLIAETLFESMKESGSGNVLNLSSIGVKYGSGFDSVFYGASKAALEATTKTLAREGAPFNILVNTIRPGVTDTGFLEKAGKDIKERAKLIPLKRAASPEEIANFVYFLSQENSYITGQTIAISGGE